MNKIQILDESTASRIAAGEVIERPAGVLKELLENAVDAGANAINIDIENAGKTLIRVNDNGDGMNAEDLLLSVQRHSTSKIKDFADLDNLNTFGFRGEALYSVAAVSKLSVSSCVEGGSGSKIIVEGGKVIAQAPSINLKGTTVEVRELFFNTPARLKFLKSDNHERGLLLKIIEESALANIHIAYTVRTDGRTVYNLPALCGDFKENVMKRAESILGTEAAKNLVYSEDEKYSFKAFYTPVNKLVASRDLQFVFVNKRPLTAKTLQQAVYKAYQANRPKDRHPAFIIYMQMNPADFDVNIHPQKREIKFLNENAIFGFIMNKTAQALDVSNTAVELSINKIHAQENKVNLEEMFRKHSPSQQPQEAEVFTAPPKQSFLIKDFEEPVSYSASAPEEEKEASSQPAQPQDNGEKCPAWWQGPYRYLGALHKSYLIYENPQGLILVDQHAARERVLYEEYLRELEANDLGVQPLMFPVTVEVPASNVENLMAWKDWLKQSGFDIEQFSPRVVMVNTVPNILRFKEGDLKDFILSIAAIAGDPQKSSDKLKTDTIALLACKKAIKAKEDMSAAEAEALLLDLKVCDDGMHCPHGRPVMISLATPELSKKFGR
ncbi:DNA mismatch repair protein MutL [Elusimicrobium posterum]|uniref:DNA mismatch repair endonuclease MutL n=1 Tax=Elusimicrobium posterum TaxID=3116653 RepID=UPI003C70AFC7